MNIEFGPNHYIDVEGNYNGKDDRKVDLSNAKIIKVEPTTNITQHVGDFVLQSIAGIPGAVEETLKNRQQVGSRTYDFNIQERKVEFVSGNDDLGNNVDVKA